ncbi:uncharacterized protein XM38_000440 [Halomicronema hongdechloris C2206]|uniref:Uncharacterized protein n=1 Tax=Halomicronema hongdechloris C2206 TaxID=1641165 RepID=A0A1Z3HFR3_9CYAN|nr:uncharacterized protein XM38_000440 [Halomicronema hongdechloris C2206]
MFLDELTPLVKELTRQPVAFLGGVASGLLRLNLNEEPVKSWLAQQTGSSGTPSSASDKSSDHNGSGPQKISIE